MREYRIYIVTEILFESAGDTAEVLTVGSDHKGRFSVINDFEAEWPLFAHEWRGLAADQRQWIHHVTGLRR